MKAVVPQFQTQPACLRENDLPENDLCECQVGIMSYKSLK